MPDVRALDSHPGRTKHDKWFINVTRTSEIELAGMATPTKSLAEIQGRGKKDAECRLEKINFLNHFRTSVDHVSGGLEWQSTEISI